MKNPIITESLNPVIKLERADWEYNSTDGHIVSSRIRNIKFLHKLLYKHSNSRNSEVLCTVAYRASKSVLDLMLGNGNHDVAETIMGRGYPDHLEYYRNKKEGSVGYAKYADYSDLIDFLKEKPRDYRCILYVIDRGFLDINLALFNEEIEFDHGGFHYLQNVKKAVINEHPSYFFSKENNEILTKFRKYEYNDVKRAYGLSLEYPEEFIRFSNSRSSKSRKYYVFKYGDYLNVFCHKKSFDPDENTSFVKSYQISELTEDLIDYDISFQLTLDEINNIKECESFERVIEWFTLFKFNRNVMLSFDREKVIKYFYDKSLEDNKSHRYIFDMLTEEEQIKMFNVNHNSLELSYSTIENIPILKSLLNHRNPRVRGNVLSTLNEMDYLFSFPRKKCEKEEE